MTRNELLVKMLSNLSQIRSRDIKKSGKEYLQQKDLVKEESENVNASDLFDKDSIGNMRKGYSKLEDITNNLYIREQVDTESGFTSISFDTVKKEIGYLQRRHNTQKILVLVDHLQLFPVDPEKYHDTIEKENLMMAEFNNISKATGSSILLISQMNKEGLKVKNNSSVAFVKGSVNITYVADMIMSLYESKKDEPEGSPYNTDTQNEKKSLCLNITSRESAGGLVNLDYNGAVSTFNESF